MIRYEERKGVPPAGYLLGESGLIGGSFDDWTTLSRVYRVFGGDSSQFGSSFTPYNPFEVANYAERAGLPPGNTAQFVLQGELPLSYPVSVAPASPINGVGGGLTEFVVPNAQRVLYWTKVLPF